MDGCLESGPRRIEVDSTAGRCRLRRVRFAPREQARECIPVTIVPKGWTGDGKHQEDQEQPCPGHRVQ